MKFQKHWYLGFLGFIGIYYVPTIIDLISIGGNLLDWTNALWFLWFLYFIPDTAISKNDEPNSEKKPTQ